MYAITKSLCSLPFIEVLHPLQIEKSLGYFSGEISEGGGRGGRVQLQ